MCNPGTCGDAGYTPPDCSNQGGYVPSGGPYACCAGSDTCTCQEYDEAIYECVGTACVPELNFGYVDRTGCTKCDDGNFCTDDSCSGGTCQYANNGNARVCYTGPPGTQGVGLCVSGLERCGGGVLGPCIDEVIPAGEVCGGSDEDCDGMLDEGCDCSPLGDTEACYPGPPSTLGVGECSAGLRECRDDVLCQSPFTTCWSDCGGAIVPQPEICDNLDNDCDGNVDGILEFCYTGDPLTRGVGECRDGVRGCAAGAWGPCNSEVLPQVEICGDGLDNDCDGVVDNDCPSGCAGPETCDGTDEDCDGLIDEGVALPAGQTCIAGSVFPSCDGVVCDPGDVCMAPSLFCSPDETGCQATNCPTDTDCLLGTCFTNNCSSHAVCDPGDACYNNGLCLSLTDPCSGLNCPEGQICYKGACYDPCASTAECTNPLECFDGRCAPDACTAPDGTIVACPFDEACYGGNCFDVCTADSQCGANEFCPAGRCATDNCENVQCPEGDVCFGGNCYEGCAVTDCSPGSVCYDEEFCASPTEDLCATSQCGDRRCYKGICYDDCLSDSDCENTERCYDGRCVDVVAGACDGVPCPAGESCLGGECFPTCDGDVDCSAANSNSFCYQEVCVDSTSCAPGKCASDEVCHLGVCFLACGPGDSCPESLSCFDGDGPARCAPSACEAMDSTFIANYNNNHPFREDDQRLRAWQTNRPWVFPRPVVSNNPRGWTQISGNFSANSIHREGRARVTFIYEPGEEEYFMFLSHGSLDPGQQSADAVYSIHVFDAYPGVEITDDEGLEAALVRTDGNDRHIQIMITTNGADTGSALIGPFEADDDWQIEIYGAFYGDGIETWEIMNGENLGESTMTLDPLHPLIVKSENFSDSEYLDPTIGTVCEPEGRAGICSKGTWLGCENHERRCIQTVNSMGAELCNGEDDNCNGDVDELKNLVVPTAQQRQWPEGYREWVTYDTATPITGSTYNPQSNLPLLYTPLAADDRRGTTTMNLPWDGQVQENSNQARVFAHRDLSTGRMTFGFVQGKTETNAGWSTRTFEMDLRSIGDDRLRDVSVPWYEDRTGDNDQVYEEYDVRESHEEADIRMRIESRAGEVETDAFVVGVRPLTQLNWNTVDPETRGFRVQFEYPGTNPYDWILHSPGSVDGLRTDRQLRARIFPRPITETVCRSNSPTATCDLGRYACIGGELRCSPANNSICSGCRDIDGDGQQGYDPSLCPTGTDCDDGEAAVYLGAPENCDGLDNNCDGLIDQVTEGCPGGADVCGPVDCGYRNVCICPEDASCYCGEGLGE